MRNGYLLNRVMVRVGRRPFIAFWGGTPRTKCAAGRDLRLDKQQPAESICKSATRSSHAFSICAILQANDDMVKIFMRGLLSKKVFWGGTLPENPSAPRMCEYNWICICRGGALGAANQDTTTGKSTKLVTHKKYFNCSISSYIDPYGIQALRHPRFMNIVLHGHRHSDYASSNVLFPFTQVGLALLVCRDGGS